MHETNRPSTAQRDPWNKGRLIGQKRPLKPKDVWSIRVRLQLEHRASGLAMFNLAIESTVRYLALRWMTRSPLPSRSSCKPLMAATLVPVGEGRSPLPDHAVWGS